MAHVVPDLTPTTAQTPETYLGWQRLSADYVGSPIEEGKLARYVFPPRLAFNGYAYGGQWRVGPEQILAGRNARLRIHYFAPLTHLVLTGTMTDICVLATAIGGMNREYRMTVAEDATATLRPEIQRATLDVIGRAYGRVLTTKQISEEIGGG